MKFRKILRDKKKKRELTQLSRLKSIVAELEYQRSAFADVSPGIGNDLEHHLVVSLTTFNKRINDVYLTIESLFRQSLKADKIILWLSREEFDQVDIPSSLRILEKRGLTIAICDEDLGPYKKFFYTVKDHPESLIVTVDDDVIYPPDMLDMLYRAWLKDPDSVHCHRAHKIGLGGNGELLPYEQWDKNTSDSSRSRLIMPTGIGGVLYFPGCFHEELLNKALFLKLAPRADDIWLKAMTLKQGVLSKKIEDVRPWKLRFLTIDGSQLYALKHENMKGALGNTLKAQKTFEYFDLMPELVRVDMNED